VVLAANGTEALEECARARAEGALFGVVILDLTVPGAMGGRETLERLRERFPALSVIISSGYGQEADLADCQPVAVLPKPYQMHELLACVGAAMPPQDGRT